MKFQDYYDILGVEREASADVVQAAYRKLARKYHPDVSKEKDAEDRFKQINEAYEVLSDSEKRAKYDALGAGWQNGQDFQAPPGWENMFGEGNGGGMHFSSTGTGGAGFSDFFEQLFGGRHAFHETAQGFQHSTSGSGAFGRKGDSLEANFDLSIEDLIQGGKRSLSFDFIQSRPDGQREKSRRTFAVSIPPGTKHGSTIRLSGQGAPGLGGGASGDLLLRVRVLPHDRFRVSGFDIESDLPIAPWEAALGAKVPLKTPKGEIQLTIPAGTQSGTRFRIPGKGLPKKGGVGGDFYALAQITVPKTLSEEEKKLFERLKEESSFKPRG